MPSKPKAFPFLIGADPEMTILLQSRRVNADRIITHVYKGQLQHDDMGFKVGKFGIFGWDGMSSTGEIRPSPANSPKEVVNNIRELFKDFVKRGRLFDMTVLSDGASLGGHIHLELPETITRSGSSRNIQTVISNIHKKLSSFYLPVMMGENRINVRMRLKMSYGKITDHRTHDHDDGSKSYEFRVPTAEWLATPEIAEATLAYLATVYNEIIRHPRNFAKAKGVIWKSQKQGESLQDLLLTDFTVIGDAILDKMKKFVRTFEFYSQYKSQIEFIFQPKKVIETKEKTRYNINQGWKLDTAAQPTKRLLVNEKQLKIACQKIDVETLAKYVPITYNSDDYVESFVRAIKNRVIAYNWKLGRTYFFYGLRKGIDDFIVTDKNFGFYHGHKQIKTQRDLNTIRDSWERMNQKFPVNGIFDSEEDQKKTKSRYTLVGIPYQLRIEENHRSLIELICELEKKIVPKTVTPNELPARLPNLPDPESYGPIWVACNLTEESQIEEAVIGDDARAQNARMAVQEEISQEENVMTSPIPEGASHDFASEITIDDVDIDSEDEEEDEEETRELFQTRPF